MAPFKPHHIYTGQITIETSASDEQAQKVLERDGKPSSPPPHLHQYQTEYFKVEQGLKGVNISGKIMTNTSEDPEYIILTN
ncbi:hypothetical protein N7467_005208 [Penicillium canescens]|nr:hypothetical protein N7467_005208 [Penicillium canescens]